MLVAALFDRRALTLRAVALAALIVLALRPEALTGPGFRISFAATTALVTIFGWLRDRRARGEGRRLPRWAVPVAAVAISSAVAGLAALLAPFGAAWLGLAIMEPAILWILAVARRVASWDGAVSHVVTPQPWILPVLVLGLLWLVLWKGRALGLAPAALALAVWPMTERLALLIADAGGLVGLLIEDGRGVEGAGADLAILAGCAEGPAPEADGCRVIDRGTMAKSGALAAHAGQDGLRLVRVADSTGRRRWNAALRATRQQ